MQPQPKTQITINPSKRGFALKFIRLNWNFDGRKTAVFLGNPHKVHGKLMDAGAAFVRFANARSKTACACPCVVALRSTPEGVLAKNAPLARFWPLEPKITENYTHQLSKINAGGNVNLTADSDVNLVGVNLTGNSGSITSTNGDINIASVKDSSYTYDRIDKGTVPNLIF